MRHSSLLLLLFIALFTGADAQNGDNLSRLKTRFTEFEYEAVVKAADSLLQAKQLLSSQELIAVYVYKGVAHYALDDEPQARRCFIEILKIDRLYTLDPEVFSPKIASLFEQVKAEYQQLVVPTLPTVITVYDSAAIRERDLLRVETGQKRSMLWRSLLLPGWGHLFGGDEQKGIILSAASAAVFTSAIYFIFDSRSKELKYLSSTSAEAIAASYNSYNAAYKARNILLAASALLWIYAQADLIYVQPGQGGFILGVLSPGTAAPGISASIRYRF